MRVGVVLPCSAPIQLTRAELVLAEQASPDTLWLTDHLLGISHPNLEAASEGSAPPDRWLDPLCVAAALAPSVALPLGVAVTDGTRRRPADLVRSALTLAHLGGAGFNLGIGAGEAMNLTPFGYSFDRPVQALEGFLADVRRLLDGGCLDGFPLSRSGLVGSAVPTPRLWVAGHGPRMLALTGRYADGWLPSWPMAPADYEQRRAVVATAAAAVGRPAPEPGLFVNVLLDNSRDAVLSALDAHPLAKLRALGAPGWLWAKHGLEHPGGADCRGFVDVIVHEMDPEVLRELAPRIPAELLADLWFVGSEADVLARVAAYREAGCEHVVLADAGSCLDQGSPTAHASGNPFASLVRALTADAAGVPPNPREPMSAAG